MPCGSSSPHSPNSEVPPVKLEGESWAHYLARSIGRYVNSDADTDLRREAREKLFDAYDDWCEAGRPSDGTEQ